MAKDIEKELLDELKRFNQIKHNSENLNEQQVATIGGIGGVANLGMGSHVERLLKRAKAMEMTEQGEEIPSDPEAEEEEIVTGDETPIEDEGGEVDMGDETPIEDEGGDVDIEDDMGGEIDAEIRERRYHRVRCDRPSK